jgi:hypothetical protein
LKKKANILKTVAGVTVHKNMRQALFSISQEMEKHHFNALRKYGRPTRK